MLVFFVVIYFLYFLVVPFPVWACFIEFACGDLAIKFFFFFLPSLIFVVGVRNRRFAYLYHSLV